MKFASTRGKSPAVGFSECLELGLAPDGGLYVPETFPSFDARDFLAELPLPELAARVLEPFLKADPLASKLEEICGEAFSFPAPLRSGPMMVLELFHGPTSAFKDFGARFLAACLSRKQAPKTRTVLVATSGDTGGAVAAAFHGRPGFEVVILFPKGKVSARQEKQLTAWGGNVRAFSVRGDFDDCQRLVKGALADPWWRSEKSPVSANSINIGRLLPQTIYYAAASLAHVRLSGRPPEGFVIPSGNLGNAVAALWARRVGFPVGRVVIATNANKPIPDYFATGVWKPAPTVATLANAMDVGDPSNMERLIHLFPSLEVLKTAAQAVSISDEDIRAEIRESALAGEILCPHTAVAARARRVLRGPAWIIVATAHPAKFETIVEPLIGRAVDIPPALAAILGRESKATELAATAEALRAAVSA